MSFLLSVYGNKYMNEYVLSARENVYQSVWIPARIFEEEEGKEFFFFFRDGEWGVRNSLAGKTLIPIRENEYYELYSSINNVVVVLIRKLNINAFKMYRPTKGMTVGRDRECDLYLAYNRRVSRKHFVLDRNNGHKWIIDISSPNGLYMNGKKCTGRQIIHDGDIIEIFGYHMVFLGDYLFAESLEKAGKCSLKEEAWSEEKGKKTFREIKGYYHRSPRDQKLAEKEIIVIEKPPDIRPFRRDPLWNLAGPMFTMMIPMISGSLFMIYAAKSSGSEFGLTLYSGIVMALVSGFCTILWSVIQRVLSAREEKKEISSLTDRYMDYLSRMNLKLTGIYEDHRTSLIERSPGVERLACLKDNSPNLWNRNPYHSDFLSCRVGIGNLPCPLEIKTPSEEFRNYGKDLWMELAAMSDRYRVMYKVPVLVNIRDRRLIGFVGRKQGDQMDFLRSLTIQIAAVHCYTEVKLAYIYNRQRVAEGEGIESLRWLPHVYDQRKKDRYIASSREEARELLHRLEKIFRDREEESGKGSTRVKRTHYVVFILEPEYLEGELFFRFFDGQNRKAIKEQDKKDPLSLTGIWVVPERECLPNACTYIIEKNEVFQGIYPMDEAGGKGYEVTFDGISPREFDSFCRKISNIRVAEVEVTGEIPDTVSFFQLYSVEGVEGLQVPERWKKNRAYEGLQAIIGSQAGGAACLLDISEKCHGPHGLVAGTTGSGKSEMLQTLLLSLAVNYSPCDVNFFLIDYKGGGMADLFEDLPHLCGQISNLSGNLIQRAMVSIKSENQRRQRLFRRYKVNNINDYQRMYYEGRIREVLPHLIIVIDEFAELKKEEPDFMKELISVAQVGRSLGVHLILATQKPGGTVDDKIWSNSRFRVCLRVQERADSMDMLHTSDAASITQTGRGYLQVGNNEIYRLFQSGWSGAPAFSQSRTKRTLYPVLPNGKIDEKALPEWKGEKGGDRCSQLEAVTEYISRIAGEEGYGKGRGLWMAPLPRILDLGKLWGSIPGFSESPCLQEVEGYRDPTVVLGLIDDPQNQKQPLYELALYQSGHILVCGVPMSGKSVVLQTLLFNLCVHYRPEVVHIYGIDTGGGSMRAFRNFPQAGMIAMEGEGEKIHRILQYADRKIGERKAMFSGGNFIQYNKNHEKKLPLILMFIDNYPGFREETSDQYEETILRIGKEGEKTGLILVVTGSGISMTEIPSSLAGVFRTKICLEQKETFAYTQILGSLSLPDSPIRGIAGRGIALLKDRFLEFQTALCLPDIDDYARMEYIEEMALTSPYRDSLAETIRIIPEHLSEEAIRKEIKEPCLPAGYRDRDARFYTMDLSDIFCFLALMDRASVKEDYLSTVLWVCGNQPDVCLTVIGNKEEHFDGENGMSFLTGGEEILSFFHEMIPLITERNELKKQGISTDKQGGHSYIHHLILIKDLAWFLNMAYDSRWNMGGFLENLWEKGQGLGITFLSLLGTRQLAEVKAYEAFDIYSSYGRGLQLDGVLSETNVFDLSGIDFKDQMEVLAGGRGYCFGPGGIKEKILLPGRKAPDIYQAERRIVDSF